MEDESHPAARTDRTNRPDIGQSASSRACFFQQTHRRVLLAGNRGYNSKQGTGFLDMIEFDRIGRVMPQRHLLRSDRQIR